MLLRVLRPLSGAVDGIDLTRFDAGRVYDIVLPIAQFLLAINAAEPVDGPVESAILPARQRMFSDQERPRWRGAPAVDRRSARR